MAASNSIFCSCVLACCCRAARKGASASATRWRRGAPLDFSGAVGSICASSFCATSGLRKYTANSSRNTWRSCSRLMSTASSAAAMSCRARPTSNRACWASAMRAASTGTPARRRARPKPVRLSASLPLRASPNCEAVPCVPPVAAATGAAPAPLMKPPALAATTQTPARRSGPRHPRAA